MLLVGLVVLAVVAVLTGAVAILAVRVSALETAARIAQAKLVAQRARNAETDAMLRDLMAPGELHVRVRTIAREEIARADAPRAGAQRVLDELRRDGLTPADLAPAADSDPRGTSQ